MANAKRQINLNLNSQPERRIKSEKSKSYIGLIFLLGLPINFLWELAEYPLYEGLGTGSFQNAAWHCLKSATGDGLMILIVFMVGGMWFGRPDWFAALGVRGYLIMLVTGLLLGLSSEWIDLRITGRWLYADQMPVLFGCDWQISSIIRL